MTFAAWDAGYPPGAARARHPVSAFVKEGAISSDHLRAIHRYLEQQMTGVGSLDLLIKTFDYAIAGCDRRDAAKVEKGLAALEQSLNFRPSRELANSFFGIYHHCRDLLLRQAFDETGSYLRSLRDSWCAVKAQRESATPSETPADRV